jgi:peptide/nickel transport system substrate-binding protein
MSKNPFRKRISFCAGAAILLLAACQNQAMGTAGTAVPAVPSATPQATATNRAPRSLTVCMGEEPASLFLYYGGGLAAHTILDAVYDGPIDTLNYSQTPVILEQVPTLENGGAVLKPVTVQPGGKIINDAGAVAALVANVRYRPSGCTDSSCVATYSEGAVVMDQLVATFRMKSGLFWSDGKPLTSDDSLYSYELASAPDINAPSGLRIALMGTQSYEAVDETTIRWTGLPGNMDPTYYLRFWSPLPRHAWGQMKPADLTTAEESARKPMGWGPYVIQDWVPGKSIRMTKNPYYFRADEGLPKFDILNIRFIGDDGEMGISALLSGECDLVDQTVRLDDQIPMLLDLQQQGILQAAISTGTAWEHLDFNLNPAKGYGKTYLQDPRLRQAVAYCLDRQKIVSEALAGLSVVPDSYVPPQHPLHNPDVAKYPYDPDKGKALLDQIGWKDADGDPTTPRTASAIPGVTNGTELRLNIVTVDSALRHQVAEIIGSSLMTCGIDMLTQFEDNLLYVRTEDSTIWGRRFELAEFSFLSGVEPSCELYTSSELPDITNNWNGANITGFSDPAYDQACNLANRSLPYTSAYRDNHLLAQKIFAEQLPSIPLYLTVKLSIARPDFVGLILDPTASSGLWNIESFDIYTP